jgi:hypothetical protein
MKLQPLGSGQFSKGPSSSKQTFKPLEDISDSKWSDIYILVFISVLFTIAKKLKHPKSLITNEWIKKTWFIQTMEYYSALEKQEIRTHSTTWMNPENIMLSEIS